MQNAIVVDEKAVVYSTACQNSNVMCELYQGDEIKLISSKGAFIPILLPEEKRGFVKGSVKVFKIREVMLSQSSVNVLNDPSPNALIKTKLSSKDKFTVTGIITNNNMQWVVIKYRACEIGYIPGTTKVKNITPENSASGNIVMGGVICLIGLIVTIGSYSAVAQTGGTYFVAWGAILFGGIRFLKGLGQL